MRKIALDATYATAAQPTGIAVYSLRLISALAAETPVHNNSDYRLTLCFRPGPYVRAAKRMRWPEHASLSPLIEFLGLPRGADLFHGLNQRLPRTRYSANVVTIHDLFPITSVEYSKPGFQKHFTRVLQQTIARADRIIAVSDATRVQLLHHTSASNQQIRVVHHGVDPAAPPSAEEQQAFRTGVLRLKPGENFFLNVGAIQVRKNIGRIVLALQRLPKFRLVLAGGDGFGAEDVLRLIENEGLAGRVIRLGHTPPSQLRLLYATATALVFPSLEEGFGFPILEAMSYGCPVITSNCSSMPEVAGNAALLVDPRDVAQIQESMRRVAEDKELAADLRVRGFERTHRYSWSRCAMQTWEVYQDLLH